MREGIKEMARLVWILSIVPACLGAAPPAAGTAERDVGLTFSLSRTEGSQYEPVALQYRITNYTPEPIEVRYGDVREPAWIGLRCVRPDGSPVARIKSLQPRKRGGLTISGARVSPGGWLDGRIVLNRLLNVARPGRYILYVDASLPWTRQGESASKTSTLRERLTFNVRPADPNEVSLTIHRLVADALDGSKSYVQRQTALEGLLRIPESLALPAWRRLLSPQPSADAYFIIGTAIPELVSLGTPTAADLLAAVAWGPYSRQGPVAPPQVPDLAYVDPGLALAGAAQNGLLDMLRAGDAATRKHVEDLFLAHEGTRPG